jgi:hypothetical protein
MRASVIQESRYMSAFNIRVYFLLRGNSIVADGDDKGVNRGS